MAHKPFVAVLAALSAAAGLTVICGLLALVGLVVPRQPPPDLFEVHVEAVDDCAWSRE
jgi:hypothetical protein